MSRLRKVYNSIDERIREFSRTKYAIFIGLASASGATVASTAIGEPDYVFSTTIGLTMTIMYYIFDPNQNK